MKGRPVEGLTHVLGLNEKSAIERSINFYSWNR